MSGDRHEREESDGLDEDFILEDLSPTAGDDLEQLFADGAPAPVRPAKPVDPAQADADDLLFTDHTEGQPAASERFDSGRVFAEDATSEWQGEQLELEAEGAAAAGEAAGGEDFALDSDKELELVDAGASSGDTFVLDDGEQLGAAEASPEAAEAASDADPLLEVRSAAASEEPGWEPLPARRIDELAEADLGTAETEPMADAEPMEELAEAMASGEVELVDGTPAAEAAEATEDDAPAEPLEAEVAAEANEATEPWRHPALAEGDPEEAYVEAGAEEPAVVGTWAPARRPFALYAAMAASLALVGGAAAYVLQPQWFGAFGQPEQVQQVQVARPRVQVAVPLPKPVATAKPTPAPAVPEAPADPAAPVATPVVEPVPEPAPVTPAAPDTTPAPVAPPSAGTPPPAVVVAPPAADRPKGWPLPAPSPVKPSIDSPGMVRLADDLLIADAPVAAPGNPVEGMAPGSRAFVQLQNGNFFIGAVKRADREQVTLRLEKGEVTLPMVEVARLTSLGSADYEELQRMTTGSVRLTNRNRLVGSILRDIADDHVVLEFRSNRVMLPKSAIGEVLPGQDDSGVRLETTREEDDWLKSLVEREVGRGTGPAGKPPAPR